MEHANPVQIAPAQWEQLYTLTMLFFTLVLVGATGAFSLGLAHAIIPSLQMTREAPAKLVSLRPLFYVLAAVFLIGAAVIVVIGVNIAALTWQVYPVRWI